MDNFLKIKLSYSVPSLGIILLMHGWDCLCFAPEGCVFNDGGATCDFYWWTPPLLDTDFGPEPLHGLRLKNISGYIPAGALSGLNGPLTSKDTYIYFYCSAGKLRLSRDIYTPNLHWVMKIWIYTCTIEEGLSSKLLENLNSLISVIISGSTIEGSVANDAFAGLTNLRTLVVNAPFINDKIPLGIFDGLKNLTTVGLSYAKLNNIPVTIFRGLASLETINLASNNLSTLPPELFDGLRSITLVTLEDNPWNCSCNLMWLLDWLHIIDEVVCQSPPALKNRELEDALGMINCASSTPTSTSTSMSAITEVQRFSSSTFGVTSTTNRTRATLLSTSGFMVLRQSTFSQKKPLTSVPTLTKTEVVPATPTDHPTTLPATSISRSTALMTLSFPSGPWLASTAYNIETVPKQSPSLSSILTDRSTFVQAMYSSTSSGPASLNSRNSTGVDENDLRNIMLISGGGAIAGSVSVAAFLYRYVFRHKCAGG